MRTRNQSKRKKEEEEEEEEQSPGMENVIKGVHDSENYESSTRSHHGKGSLTNISREAVDRCLKRANSRKGSGRKREQSNPSVVESTEKTEESSVGKAKQNINVELLPDFGVKGSSPEGQDAGAPIHCAFPTNEEDANDPDWEDGIISLSHVKDVHCHRSGMTIEFTESPSSAQRRPFRRASVEDKELAELVHKVHLLCLLARGRLVDSACSDPLIQASLLSLLPSELLNIAEVPKLTANLLAPLVNWFHNNFHVRRPTTKEGCFKSNLTFTLGTREGSAEEIAALWVALLRALNLTTRFVSVLDVASLKPDADGCSNQDVPRLDTRISSSTGMTANPNQGSAPYSVHSSNITIVSENIDYESSHRGDCSIKDSNSASKNNLSKGLPVAGQSNDQNMDPSTSKAGCDNLDTYPSEYAERPKRKGDVEFELQLEMALSATAPGFNENGLDLDSNDLSGLSGQASPAKIMKKIRRGESPVSTQGSIGAVWSRKAGPPLYWAEVYCSGETLTGRWVHIDAANAIVDGEQRVESAAAACRRSLKYVVAFAGHGAKDVTRRYCMHWYKIASQRVSSKWWDTVLAPLKELESGTTGGVVHLEDYQENASAELEKKVGSLDVPLQKPTETSSRECPDFVNLAGDLGIEVSKQLGSKMDLESSSHGVASRNSLEDLELETRALTEPLPTNQQAYRNHLLYVLERWLTKYQILCPKGPVLGYCSGNPVYPRACVQTLQTKQKWLREGLQVKVNEVPAKVVKCSQKSSRVKTSEPGISEENDGEGTMELYGSWQMESLRLPHATNGIVPKNERGQVDVWSEKCLPPGTVHLRLPRLVPVAKRLEVDFAPAMVGFEFRNGRSIPIFEGIVVCTEFKDAVLEAYAEEEERREAEEKKNNENQALSRWYQLLSSVVTRQRLKNSYEDVLPSKAFDNTVHNKRNDQNASQNTSCTGDMLLTVPQQGFVWNAASNSRTDGDHEHVFPLQDQSFDEVSSVRTKRCPCGFSIQVEEL